MPTDTQIAAAAQVAERLAAAPHGTRGALVAEAAAGLGVSPQTLHQWMAPHRGRQRAQRRDSLARLIAQQRAAEAEIRAGGPGLDAARARLTEIQAQIGARATLTQAEAELIAAAMHESRRGLGKQLLSLKDAVATLRAQGAILAGRVDEDTGEIAHLSLSAISRGLRRYACHPEQVKAPTPHQAQRTLHPNARWEVDASVCVVYYLPDGGAAVQTLDQADYYKNRPERFERIANERVIRYVVTDHCSGVVRWRYYPHAESGAHTVAFLCWAVAPKADPRRDPFQGAPLRLVVDPGATAASTVRRWCDLLGIDLVTTRPKNPRAKGSVERAQDLVERSFEAGLRFQAHRVPDFDALNRLAAAHQLHYNATAIHTRHGRTRFGAWSEIQPEQLRITEPEAVLRGLASEAPAHPRIGGDLTVAYRGARWRVREIAGANIGARLDVLWCPLIGADGQGHAVAVLTDPETGRTRYQPLARVERDAWGFDAEAPEDGQGYASLPDTEVDRVRKRLAQLASGTETQAEDEVARRRKDFRPLAHLDEGRGLDPYRAAETTEPVAWLPRAGTEHRVSAPEVLPRLLDHVEAALRLRPMVEAAGGAWGPERYDWLAARYPAGVPEGSLEALAGDLAGETPAHPVPQAAGLRVVK